MTKWKPNVSLVVAGALFGAVALTMAAGEVIAQCHKNIETGAACTLNAPSGGDCDLPKCSSETLLANDTVTTTGSPGDRAHTTRVVFSCASSWLTPDEDQICNTLALCQSSVDGAIADGLFCGGGGGGDQ